MILKLSKTREMLLSGGASMIPTVSIQGLTFEDDACCWDLQVDGLLSKAGSQMCIHKSMQKMWISKGTSQLCFWVSYIIVISVWY